MRQLHAVAQGQPECQSMQAPQISTRGDKVLVVEENITEAFYCFN